jgi:O-antigen/teichoic acid export membrane protein
MSSTNTVTLRQRILASGSWVLAGYGLNQALRLGGNLILTRLLFPEAFGLMAIYSAVGYGVHMLTDVGIGPSIVQNERGNDPVFLNTAWTVQIVRGILVWVGLCALALPMARLYGEPLLAAMLPVVGFTAVISGFDSTKWFTAKRNLEAERVTKIEIGSFSLGLLCTIYLAWVLHSVWALVWGNVITDSLKMIASHVALHGVKNRFAWERDTLKHLRGFGRWILLSSGLTFLSSEGLRLLIGTMIDMSQLALFTLASTMSLMLWQAMQQLSGRVFFPAFAEVYRENPRNLTRVLYKARLTTIFPSWAIAVFFIYFGSQFMGFLYDARYQGSGVMLEQLAVGTLIACVWGSYSGVLLATGKVGAMTALTAIQIVFQFGSIFVGHHYWGSEGVVVGVATANWLMYPANALVMFRMGFWQPKLDMILLAASVLIVVLAWSHLTAIS